MMTTFKQLFVNRTAFRIAFAATLSLFIILAIPYHPAIWLFWYAPFSIIINMLMYPYQNKNHAILWQRFISISAAVAVSLVAFTLLHNIFLLFFVYIFLFSLFCMYRVGVQDKYKYGYFLAMIYGIKCIAFSFLSVSTVFALWQFPAAVLICIFAVAITDRIIKPHTAKELLDGLAEQIEENLRNVDLEMLVELEDFHQARRHIQQTRLQLSNQDYEREMLLNHTLRIMALKHNILAEHWTKIEDEETKSEILNRYKSIWTKSNPLSDISAKAKMSVSPTQGETKSELTPSTLVCLNELELLAKDLQDLQKIKNNELNVTNIPKPISKKIEGFNLPAFKFSIRCFVAIVLSLACVFALHLPGGIQTIVATIVTAAAPNVGASVLKVMMRAGGIITGAVAGLAVALIVSSTGSLVLYGLLFFAVLFWLARWSLSSGKYGYSGIQAGLLFIIMVSNTGSSHLDIASAIARFEGVFIGGFIAFAIVFILSPVAPGKKLQGLYTQMIQSLQSIINLSRQENPNIVDIKSQLASVDVLLAQAAQHAHEQRFLFTDRINHVKRLRELQAITDLLKQFIRLMDHSEKDRSKLQSHLANLELNLSNTFSEPNEAKADNPLTAKAQYCRQQIDCHWLALKKAMNQ